MTLALDRAAPDYKVSFITPVRMLEANTPSMSKWPGEH